MINSKFLYYIQWITVIDLTFVFEKVAWVDTHRLCLKPHPTPSFTSSYISSLYSPLDRVIENIWVNSDTDEELLLTNTITKGKNQKQNYNWQTATALNEINWNKTAEDD